jgi:LysM repeat protein
MIVTSERVLQAGESLSGIAAEVYGEVGNWRDIADKNNIDIFAVLPVGQKIVIPTLEEVQENIERVAAQAASLVDKVDSLDLSSLKQPETVLKHQLVSWIF